MSIKYGTVFLPDSVKESVGGSNSYYANVTELVKKLSPFNFKIGNSDKPDGILTPNGFWEVRVTGLGNQDYEIYIGGLIRNVNKHINLAKTKTTSSSAASTGFRYQGDDFYPNQKAHARYAINSKGDWILSFTNKNTWNSTKFEKAETGSFYVIGTTINKKPVLITSDGYVYEDKKYEGDEITKKYNVVTRITPVYSDNKITSQIAMTDFLVSDDAGNLYPVNNIKLGIVHQGVFDPYAFRDGKGNEYCVVPCSYPGESALVLMD